ncbi:hypothetical protein [Alkalimarinus alittae]|uniref:Uncharacterized protein n=1 Tax=Alkalimarinus alittae TaxID=2961619 RepID=A0ABY6N5L6_9ALTE|nr:hypothetical protein [Alkalimarinus alittae]UZE97299.1 hypothetical protein NKI27_05980 [Alkalimarinus alittae]
MLTVEPRSWIELLILSALISLGIRILNSSLRASDPDSGSFVEIFKGKDDFWLPYLIGVMEIAAYSLLLKSNVSNVCWGLACF